MSHPEKLQFKQEETTATTKHCVLSNIEYSNHEAKHMRAHDAVGWMVRIAGRAHASDERRLAKKTLFYIF